MNNVAVDGRPVVEVGGVKVVKVKSEVNVAFVVSLVVAVVLITAIDCIAVVELSFVVVFVVCLVVVFKGVVWDFVGFMVDSLDVIVILKFTGDERVAIKGKVIVIFVFVLDVMF